MLRLLIAIGVALFACFGFCCALKLLLDIFLAPRQLAIAILIREKKDADMLDMLLHEAGSAFFKQASRRPVVLLSTALMDGTVGEGETLREEYAALIEDFGAECYLIDPE